MIASQNGHSGIVNLLLENGAQVDLQKKDGWSAIEIANLNGHSEIVKQLQMYGARVHPSSSGECHLKTTRIRAHFYSDVITKDTYT